MAKVHRARSDEDKRGRRRAILDMALRMYEEEPSFVAFTMAALAERAGLAKGTLYLYFRTKDEVFLALVEQLSDIWFSDVDARLVNRAGEWRPAEVADALVSSLAGRETLARLLSIMGAIVEHNVELETALAFKRTHYARVAATGGLLESRLPFLSRGQGARLMVHLQALVVGVWQLHEPSAVVCRAMDDPDLRRFRVDFAEDLRTMMASMLEGMRSGAITASTSAEPLFGSAVAQPVPVGRPVDPAPWRERWI
ncbi:MAG TPA: TetR family transcriptional regulator [Longimicrobiaceae bacterium]|jgi:AcrR family transcriptional regulator|nr:TetR family transcriptional regulator [Longimicrobiaceae bacterium]